MRIRHRTTANALIGGVATAALLTMGALLRTPTTPPALEEAGRWSPPALDAPRVPSAPAPPSRVVRPAGAVAPTLPPMRVAGNERPAIAPPVVTWSREIASGETLDAVLADAGLSAPVRAEAALAIGSEYDLRRLRPGHEVTVITETNGTLRRLALAVEDGVTIEAIFGDAPETRVRRPDPEIVTLAAEARVLSSLYDALYAADIPARFAVDLAQMLGGTVDFRRALSGGETLRVMWSEARVGDKVIGQPQLTFAALDLGDTLLEVVWPEDGSGRATIYQGGEVLRVFAQPVDGARLSSVFGRRKHPVYGNVRMHTGVDFAAARGSPVHATAPGKVSYVGRRGGYGRTVEITHGSDTMTRYAHLSAVPEGLAVGQKVTAGDVIGRVGATGTATGPNLHYEVRVNGRPTDPLEDDRLAEATEADTPNADARTRLQEARARLEDRLVAAPAASPNERI